MLYLKSSKYKIKGEWVVVVEPKEKIGLNLELMISFTWYCPKIKAKLMAKMTGESVWGLSTILDPNPMIIYGKMENFMYWPKHLGACGRGIFSKRSGWQTIFKVC